MCWCSLCLVGSRPDHWAVPVSEAVSERNPDNLSVDLEVGNVQIIHVHVRIMSTPNNITLEVYLQYLPYLSFEKYRRGRIILNLRYYKNTKCIPTYCYHKQ